MISVRSFLMSLFVVLWAAVTMAHAQSSDLDKVLENLNQWDVKVQYSSDAQLWLERARAYYEAESSITKELAEGIDYAVVQGAMGRSLSSQEVKINETVYIEYQYPLVAVYVTKADNIVRGWISSLLSTGHDLCSTALISYQRAAELDASFNDAIEKELILLENYYVIAGNAAYAIGVKQYASFYYMMAFNVQLSPSYKGSLNYDYLMAVPQMLLEDEVDEHSRELAITALEALMDLDYHDNGNVDFYLAYFYLMQYNDDNLDETLWKALEVACNGVAVYSRNTELLEAASTLFTMVDASELPAKRIPVMKQWGDMLVRYSPEDTSLWDSRGLLYFALGNYEEAIVSFTKYLELEPQNAGVWSMVGYCYYSLANDALEVANSTYDDNNYKNALEKVNDLCLKSFCCFEEAFNLGCRELDVIKNLTNLSFRLRYNEGMMVKYEKYNKLYDEMIK